MVIVHLGEHSSKRRGSGNKGGGVGLCSSSFKDQQGAQCCCWGEESAGVSSERQGLEAIVTESLRSPQSEVESDKGESKMKTSWSVESSGPQEASL